MNAGTYTVTPTNFISANPEVEFINYVPSTVTINPAQVTVSGVTVSNKVYDTTTAALVTSQGSATVVYGNSTGGLASPTPFSNYTMTGAFGSANPGDNVTVNLTTNLGDSTNYAVSQLSQTKTTASIQSATTATIESQSTSTVPAQILQAAAQSAAVSVKAASATPFQLSSAGEETPTQVIDLGGQTSLRVMGSGVKLPFELSE
jgi:hypothetical protein